MVFSTIPVKLRLIVYPVEFRQRRSLVFQWGERDSLATLGSIKESLRFLDGVHEYFVIEDEPCLGIFDDMLNNVYSK